MGLTPLWIAAAIQGEQRERPLLRFVGFGPIVRVEQKLACGFRPQQLTAFTFPIIL